MALNLVFLLEEPSACDLLDTLLPMILPSGVSFQTIPHRGKNDLRKSIPKKLKNWRTLSIETPHKNHEKSFY